MESSCPPVYIATVLLLLGCTACIPNFPALPPRASDLLQDWRGSQHSCLWQFGRLSPFLDRATNVLSTPCKGFQRPGQIL